MASSKLPFIVEWTYCEQSLMVGVEARTKEQAVYLATLDILKGPYAEHIVSGGMDCTAYHVGALTVKEYKSLTKPKWVGSYDLRL